MAALGAAVAQAAPSATLVASRTSGVAPLAVFFDATDTTDSDPNVDPFRQLGYRFDFNDPDSGTWEHSQRSKNFQVGGPTAAHVFETPGTYQVQLTVQDAAGMKSADTVEIVVNSPNSVFSGTNTVCITRGSDFTGCPTGAERRGTAGSWPSFVSNKRYLLKTGDDFTALGTINIPRVSNVQVGSYGTGAKPIVMEVTLQSITSNPTSLDWTDSVTVMDLDMLNFRQDAGGTNLLIFRNTLTRGGGLRFGHAFGYWLDRSSLSGWKYPENLFMVENYIDAANNPDVGQYGIYAGGNRFAIMGNEITRVYMHNIRLWVYNKGFLAHNRLHGRSNDGIRHALKLHSAGLDRYEGVVTAETQSSHEIVIADNHVGDPLDNNQWLFAIEPLSTSQVNGLDSVIVERNRFITTSRTAADVHMAGRKLVMRGNTRESGGAPRYVAATSGYNIPADWYGPYFLNDSVMEIDSPAGLVAPPAAPALQVE